MRIIGTTFIEIYKKNSTDQIFLTPRNLNFDV